MSKPILEEPIGKIQEDAEEGNKLKLYILHDSNEWMKSWRPALDSQFGPDGYEEWLLDGTGKDTHANNFNLNFDFGQPPPEGLFFCKGSGSSHMRGLPHARDSFTAVLQWLEYHGRVVVNGERAFATETSKVSQLVAMSNFGLKFAKTTAVFGSGNLVQGAEAFLATLGNGSSFWIRFNRAGCGRGLCLCSSVDDVHKFVATGQTSPDEIYILQQWLNIPAVVRLEFSFGQLLYGLEVRNVYSSAAMAPCGCVPQFDIRGDTHSCTTFGQSQSTSSNAVLPVSVSRRTAVGSSSFAAVVGLVVGALLTWLTRGSIKKKLLASGLLGSAVLAVAKALAAAAAKPAAAAPKRVPALQNPVTLLLPAALQHEYPVLSTVPEKVKHLMSDLGAGTMALDVAMVDRQVMVLDINIHTVYGTEREKQHKLPFESTGIGSVCLGLSSMLRGIEQANSDLDLNQMPSDNLVFGIGLPRTGSHSLAEALKALGFRGRHNSMLMKRHGQYTPNTRQFAGYFHVDTSHFRRYQQLFTTHPNARFILTTRLDDEWTERLGGQNVGEVPKDLPSPNEYLSDVLRFFVNHHATHRLMVCNLFTEADDLLWSKLKGFLPVPQKIDVGKQPFPRIVADQEGRLSKAGRAPKSPRKEKLVGDFSAQYAVAEDASSAVGTKLPSPRSSRRSPSNSENGSVADSLAMSDYMNAKRVLSGYVDYKKTYSAKFVVRPDNAEGQTVAVLANKRLTPAEYDRNIFHLALRVEGTPLATYDAGDCIGIYPENPKDKVDEFIDEMGFDGTELLELDNHFTGAEEGVYVLSVSQICNEYLDLFGSPSRSFYLALSKFAKHFVEKEALAELALPRKTADFQAREHLACSHASTMLEFKSLELKPIHLLDLVPFTKPRLYSIASSPEAHSGEVHLLVVEETWKNSKGEERSGLCSQFLANLRPKGAPKIAPRLGGSRVVASLVRSPVLKLPKQSTKPVIMAGMGTGLAPFRAFIEERSCQRIKGQAIGNMRLYFGARYKKDEFLYQSELETYEAQGWLKLRCAWSRDQKKKIYVQHLIEKDGKEIWDALNPEAGGFFYICGPIAPVPDIKNAIIKVFNDNGLDGASYLDELEATGRFAMEVY